MKTFGIYLAFPPLVNLRHEGIGRHLVTLLRAVEKRDDARFVIACPSWSRASLNGLVSNEGKFRQDFIGPAVEPYLYRFSWFRRAISTPPSKPPVLRPRTVKSLATPFIWLLSKLVGARTLLAAATSAVGLLLLVALASPLIALLYLLDAARLRGKPKHAVRRVARFVKALAAQMAYDQEIRGMLRAIAEAKDVSAWYAPTSFWPSATEIKAPLLVCVPDIVLFDFPFGFAKADGARFDRVLQDILAVIKAGKNFVTFSNHVKQHTLIGKLGVPPRQVRVIPHAPIDLSPSIAVNVPDNAQAASVAYCEILLLRAINRSTRRHFDAKFANSQLKFIFYASQIRPSKNVVSLVRAYDHLLRNRFIGHKLILTGDPASLIDVQEEVRRRRLEFDVLFLSRLTESELAACYRLADLAISPSLFEGGMPFTFSEAACLGTPVVMADIPVTREILDAEMCELTLFDPYDWRAMAGKIEWALANRELLKSKQAAFLQRTLKRRSWDDVAGEYITILDEISRPGSQTGSA